MKIVVVGLLVLSFVTYTFVVYKAGYVNGALCELTRPAGEHC